MYCYHEVFERDALEGGTVQVNGFKIEVKPVNDPDGADSVSCRATVTSPKGKVVYQQSDWGMEIDPITGKHINGDGEPDAVLVDYSGGAHCCWTYDVVSLGKNPGLIGKFYNRDTASFSDLRGDGQIEISIRDGSFDFGFGLDHASSVFPLLIVQLRGTNFQDVGSECWPIFKKAIQQERRKLDNADLQEFLHPRPNQPDNSDHEMTRSTLLLIALDYLYGGKYPEAKNVLAQFWPQHSQEKTWKEMLDGYCSGLRFQMGLQSVPPCENKKTDAYSSF